MNKTLILSLLLVASFGVTTASAVDLIDVDGTWNEGLTVGGVNVGTFTVGNQEQIRWGTPYRQPNQSGLGFTPGDPILGLALDTPFLIGELAHFNFEQQNNTAASQTVLDLVLQFGDPAGTANIALTFDIDETPGLNTDDIISFPAGMSQNIALGGTCYKFTFLGFTDNQTEFISPEGFTNTTEMFGMLSECSVIPAPGALLLGSLGAGLVGLVRGRKRV